MIKTKRNRIEKNDAKLDLETIKVGDVVAIEWHDVHAYERIRLDEIRDLEEPGVTHCWGRSSESPVIISLSHMKSATAIRTGFGWRHCLTG